MLWMLLACAGSVAAQGLHLRSGDTYTSQFVSLHQEFFVPPDPLPSGVWIAFSGDLLDASDTLRVEMLESPTATVPFWNHVFSGSPTPSDRLYLAAFAYP